MEENKEGHHDAYGYFKVYAKGHPKAHQNHVLEHILIAERALGSYLPPKVVVHHINDIKDDNRGENLVICQDQIYHMLLHKRQKALRATGNPNKRQCYICKEWDEVSNLKIYRSTIEHSRCRSILNKRKTKKIPPREEYERKIEEVLQG